MVRRGQVSYREEIRRLLQARLKAAGLFLLVAHLAFTLLSVMVDFEPPLGLAGQIFMLGVWVAVTGSLFYWPELSLPRLRLLEVTILVVSALYLGTTNYIEMQDFALLRSAGGPESYQALIGRLAQVTSVSHLLPYIWLMLLYGMLIPNIWQRAALACLPVALTPIAARLIFRAGHPEVSGVASMETIALNLFLITLGYASAVYGTYVINSLRVEAFEARRMGQYELVEKLGSGGMGEVWKGRHRMLARPAAIKLIRTDMLGTQTPEQAHLVLQRFEKEAQATAGLNSPHSIMVYDFGITENETFYYVMELLDGLDLESLVRQFGPVPSSRALHLLVQACESLADAHASGLIHRDIKPANLFTCRLGRVSDFVKVLDFGLVKDRELGDEPQMLTQAGAITGTPACIAPEQALGQDIDHRADLYGLGCVAYWLVTGRSVFQGDSVMAVLADHIKTSPDPPSQVSEMAVADDLESVILSCLAKSPEDRPDSAEALAEALKHCRDYGSWEPAKAAQWWDRHRGRTEEHVS
ncbi:MAG TPA: serine/threonine-protein kinase [Acidobacteriota bacterium]|nr:serine/threonine-protein kinase [Acidobacteriota bacterium]